MSANADVKTGQRRPVHVGWPALETALTEAGLTDSERQVDAIVDENETARIDGLRVSLTVLALLAAVALLFTRMIPVEPAADEPEAPRASVG